MGVAITRYISVLMGLLLTIILTAGCAGQNNRTWKIEVQEGGCVTLYLNGLEVEKVNNNESSEGPQPSIEIPLIKAGK